MKDLRKGNNCRPEMSSKKMAYSLFVPCTPALHKSKTHYKGHSAGLKILMNTNLFTFHDACCSTSFSTHGPTANKREQTILAAQLMGSHSPNKSTCISQDPKPNFRDSSHNLCHRSNTRVRLLTVLHSHRRQWIPVELTCQPSIFLNSLNY